MVKVNLLSHIHHSVEEMATHSSILAWRIPGMEEPSGLLSMGSHRVGHDWSNLAAAAAAAAYITGKSNLFPICYTICLRKKHKNKQNSYEKKLISYRNKYREIQNSLWNVHLGRAKSKVKNALSLWTGLRFLLLAKVYQGSIILYKVSITTLSDRPCQHRFFFNPQLRKYIYRDLNLQSVEARTFENLFILKSKENTGKNSPNQHSQNSGN